LQLKLIGLVNKDIELYGEFVSIDVRKESPVDKKRPHILVPKKKPSLRKNSSYISSSCDFDDSPIIVANKNSVVDLKLGEISIVEKPLVNINAVQSGYAFPGPAKNPSVESDDVEISVPPKQAPVIEKRTFVGGLLGNSKKSKSDPTQKKVIFNKEMYSLLLMNSCLKFVLQVSSNYVGKS
jgi:hypothetical protein